MDMVFPILPSIPFPSTYTVLRLWDLCTRVAKVEDGWVLTIIPANYITWSAITSSALCAVPSLENYTPIVAATLLLLACSKYNYILLSLVPKPSSLKQSKWLKTGDEEGLGTRLILLVFLYVVVIFPFDSTVCTIGLPFVSSAWV